MKTLYFDCSSGISGNMTLGALTEIIGDEDYLINELKKLNVGGYKIEISKQVKNGITGTYVDVILEHHEHHDHEHHHHEHRNLNDVNKIIDDSELDLPTKELAKKIFLRVAKAESKVHHKPLDEVHFHEVGAIDSIVDIVGTAILINKIKPDRILSSIVNDGYGFIECAHGTMSVPVPATTEIFASSRVKFRQINIPTELVTPTGAAIIAELAESFTVLPAMVIDKIGWGAGYKDLRIPNVLKVYLGESNQPTDDFVIMESNIDDCCGEILGYVSEELFNHGALDVFFTPIYMKKNRPAYQLSVACRSRDIKKLQDIIFKETTTIGIRYHYEYRHELPRVSQEFNTKYGDLTVKVVNNKEETYVYPEYESLVKIAREKDIPLKELYKIVGVKES